MKIQIKNGPEFEILEGETLLSALGRGGIPVSAPCGGKRRCGKCAVRIIQGRVRDAFPAEPLPDYLTDEKSVVLACRSIPETDLILEVSESAYEGGAYQKISHEADGVGGAFTGNDCVSYANAQKQIARSGVALDIGTTTVSARLIDLDSGIALDTYSALNRQRVFGADVMSRIGAARSGKTRELYEIINNQTAEILSGFIKKFNLAQIKKLVVAANTTMLHLFANEDPSSMGEIPFKPVFLDQREFTGKDLALPVEKVALLPSISAFLGADVVSGLGEKKIPEAGETVFFIDIGTNGEMALFNNGKLFCASAAAGPALEGAEISCGVGSILGAINKVEWLNNELRWQTIGNEAPTGICGCGLIDAIALMLNRGIIDETGSFSNDEMTEFKITDKIALTNRDVRQYQLAKSAILSAIKIVCKNSNITLNEIKKVYVAGGLGFYIDRNSAVRSGLLPEEFLDKIEVCGNTSLNGAVKALMDPGFTDYCGHIVKSCEVMELAADPGFMDAFAENMIFPV